MKLLRGSHCSSLFTQGSVVTIGNFDGVHKGHQALLQGLKQKAEVLKLPLVVILFEPQPQEYFNPDKPTARLQSLREKITHLAQYGADYVYRLKFDAALAQMSAKNFVNTYLCELLNTRYLMVGEDFHFGYQRAGDLPLLKVLLEEHKAELAIFPAFPSEERRVSSTKIRSYLEEGQLREAGNLLGRTYSLCGLVVQGKGLGRQWGIPTANIRLNRPLLSLKGVFCVEVRLKTGIFLQGVANLGLRPTLDGVTMVLEIHLLNFNAHLYGQRIEVFFLHKIRDEQKFPSVDALIKHIQQDIAFAKAWFLLEKTYDRL